MTKYPDPIELPEEVFSSRSRRQERLLYSAKWGIALRLSIIIAELAGFYRFGSYALLMDGLASSLDIVSSVALIFCIRLAGRPPDKKHPFGYGRFEPLAGLQLGLLLVIIGGFMAVQEGWRLAAVPDEILNPYIWIIPLSATVILELCYHFLIRTAKRQHSPALAAEAIHYRIDALTSLFATVALIIAAFVPHWSAMIDHIGALSIAVLMIGLGAYASKKNLDQIIDRVPDENFFTLVRNAAPVSPVFEKQKRYVSSFMGLTPMWISMSRWILTFTLIEHIKLAKR